MQEHVTREQLSDRAEQRLKDKQRLSIESHLRHCQRCRELEQETKDVMRRLSADAADLDQFRCEDAVMRWFTPTMLRQPE